MAEDTKSPTPTTPQVEPEAPANQEVTDEEAAFLSSLRSQMAVEGEPETQLSTEMDTSGVNGGEEVEAAEETAGAENVPDVNSSSSADNTATTVAVPESSPASASATPVASDVIQAEKPNSPTPQVTTVTAAQNQEKVTAPTPPKAGKRKRLPQDIVGQLEDRIKEDPRGDTRAWLDLLDEHKKKGKFDEARAVYERFLAIFPTAASVWIDFIRMETSNNDFTRVESLFSRSLLQVLNVSLWSQYLDYIRRRNVVSHDPSGKTRGTVNQAYEFVLNKIGVDQDAGDIYREYITFLKSAQGNINGNSWIDGQKVDMLRRAYQRAITQPFKGVDAIWREYNQFEDSVNKATAKNFIRSKSAAYMTARSCSVELSNLTKGLRRDTLPLLSPAPGFDGYEDWHSQVAIWKRWIEWEKKDELVLAQEDPAQLSQRIHFAYKQALMAMRFCPELWFDYADWCFQNNLEQDGTSNLTLGIQANPESPLLSCRYAERLEESVDPGDGDDGIVRKGKIVRKPYDDLLDVLYKQITKVQEREKMQLELIEDEPLRQRQRSQGSQSGRDDDDEDDEADQEARKQREYRIDAIKNAHAEQVMKLREVISAVWINLMKAMRRIQGHGVVNQPIGGSRQIFADARKKGKITSDVYIASAMIEYHCYKDPAALKIFERGMKLFPEDEKFALEYLKHLVHINDITNARAVFETFVARAPAAKAKIVFDYWYSYESQYGELAQIYKLEKRMNDLYSDADTTTRFSMRYSYKEVDPCKAFVIVSPAQQCRPRNMGTFVPLPFPPPPPPPPGQEGSFSTPLPVLPAGLPPPPPPLAQLPKPDRISSPKRQLDSDDDFNVRDRKRARPESPGPQITLKGAAGRRLKEQKRQQEKERRERERGGGGFGRFNTPPPNQQGNGHGLELGEIYRFLHAIPGAQTWQQAVRFKPDAMTALMRGLTMPSKEEVERESKRGRYKDWYMGGR